MKNKISNGMDFDKLVNALKSASLTDAEKVYSKNVIFNHVEETSAVRNIEEERLTSVGIKRSILTQIIFKRMPVFLAIAMLFSGGVSFAAEGTLPGDLLYPVKVGVNENVGQVLAFSEEAKAKYEAKIANKRVIEAERLVEAGKMTPERAAELNAKFVARAEKARERFSKLEESMPGAAIEANANFQARLKARIDAMTNVAENSDDESEKEHAEKWLLKINSENAKSDALRLRMEAKMKLDSSEGVKGRAEGKLKATENVIAMATRFIVEKKDSVSAEAYTKAEAQITLANETVAEGKVKLEAEAYGEAFVLFNKAFSIAMEAKEIIKDRDERNRRSGLDIKAGIKADIKADIRAEERQERAEERRERNEDNNDAEIEAEADTSVNIGNSGVRGNGGVKVKIGL